MSVAQYEAGTGAVMEMVPLVPSKLVLEIMSIPKSPAVLECLMALTWRAVKAVTITSVVATAAVLRSFPGPRCLVPVPVPALLPHPVEGEHRGAMLTDPKFSQWGYR